MNTSIKPAISSQGKVKPDLETQDRIKNLAHVGKALFSISSEVNFQNDFFIAKEALNKFREGINKLDLDEESEKGMLDLIEYLNKKIDRRMQASEDGSRGH